MNRCNELLFSLKYAMRTMNIVPKYTQGLQEIGLNLFPTLKQFSSGCSLQKLFRYSEIRNVAVTSPVPAGLRNHYFCIPSTTNNLMNNQDPKFSALLKDYTNIMTILDPKLRTQDRKQAQTPVGTSSGLFIIHDMGRSSYPIESSRNDSKRNHLECSRPHAREFFLRYKLN